MADKIDQLKIGTTLYDIDLPKDAEIDIHEAKIGNVYASSLTGCYVNCWSMNPQVNYSEGQVVIHDNRIYMCISSYTSGADAPTSKVPAQDSVHWAPVFVSE